MLDVITFGDVKLDTFVVINEASVQCQLKMPECQLCIEYGDKIPVDVVDSQVAGSAPNVAVGLARMGLKTAVVSNMGADETYDLSVRHLKAEKVQTRHIRRIKGEKSAFSVVLNFKGEKTILADQIEHAYRLPKPMPRSKWVYVCEMGSGYEDLFRSLAALKKKNGVKIAMNPGHLQIDEDKPALKKLVSVADLLFVNKQEAQQLTGETMLEIRHLARAVWNMSKGLVVITDGENGAYDFDGERLRFAPIFPAKRMEATGAGDAFATGYLGALLHGKDEGDGLRWGAVNAASVVGQVGPQPGLLSHTQIKRRLSTRKSYKTKEL